MWSRKRLDIGWLDLAAGVLGVFSPLRPRVADAPHVVTCLSVRSGLDLLLGALDLPRGSEVVVSAITIPDMLRIIEAHGLVAVPVDLDPRTMAPTIESWRRAITPATKLLLVAHLFGSRTDMAPIVELAHRQGLFVIEDCAQAFAGSNYLGHSGADASMFSFGTIKASTALGGAILRVRDTELLSAMQAAQRAYPVQSRWAYLKKVVKCGLLKILSCQLLFALVVRVARISAVDYDRRINRAVRGFAGSDFFGRIRRQPSAPLLRLLARRLRNYDSVRWTNHIAKGRAVTAAIERFVACPTSAVVPHSYWVFPVVVDEPLRLIEHLARDGFDATQGQSLCVAAAPAGRPAATIAQELLSNLVFLPFYPELPKREAERLAVSMLSFIDRHGRESRVMASAVPLRRPN